MARCGWPPLIGAFLAVLPMKSAYAQGEPARFEVFGGAGVSRMGGDEGSLGSGGTIAAGFDARIAGGWVVEADVLRTHHERSIAGGPLKGTATGAVANLVYRFRSARRVQPFALASLGMLHFSTTHTYPTSSGVVTNESTATQETWGGGGGVNIVLTPHVLLRPQFRLLFSEQTGVLGLATTSVAVGYRW